MRFSSDTARRAGLIAVAVGLGAALAGLRARASRTPAQRAGGRFRRRPVEQRFTCECGAEYRVSGTDRHRVYWPAGAGEDAPVLGDRCVECDAPLPRGRASSVA